MSQFSGQRDRGLTCCPKPEETALPVFGAATSKVAVRGTQPVAVWGETWPQNATGRHYPRGPRRPVTQQTHKNISDGYQETRTILVCLDSGRKIDQHRQAQAGNQTPGWSCRESTMQTTSPACCQRSKSRLVKIQCAFKKCGIVGSVAIFGLQKKKKNVYLKSIILSSDMFSYLLIFITLKQFATKPQSSDGPIRRNTAARH